jgi:hypothetical protein
VGAVVRYDAAHTHHWSALEEALGDDSVGLGDSFAATSDGQDAVVNTLDDLADTGLDTSLVSQFGDILASLANNDTGLLRGDDGTKGQLRLGVLLVGSLDHVAVNAFLHETVVVHVVAIADGVVVHLGRHCGWCVEWWCKKLGGRG